MTQVERHQQLQIAMLWPKRLLLAHKTCHNDYSQAGPVTLYKALHIADAVENNYGGDAVYQPLEVLVAA